VEWFSVPAELVKAVAFAKEIADQTDGALDVTIAPLIDLWGFGAQPSREVAPSADEVTAAKKSCGWDHLEWRNNPPALRKRIPDLRINVAAVTEGLVVDELVTLLRGQGLRDFLLEIGGEVAAIGHAPDGQPWRVGIQTPDAVPGETMQSLALSDLCLSTSGTYRHRFQADGRKYSHLIDPRTGQPVQHELRSASVIHESCARADGYATALTVLGPVRGAQVARRLGLRVVWILEEE
jgi:thiamine biosynthesis lipoprotein